MDEQQAKALAEIIEGEPWNSGGDIWLVCRERQDGHIVAFSDESVCEYASKEALENGSPISSIVIV